MLQRVLPVQSSARMRQSIFCACGKFHTCTQQVEKFGLSWGVISRCCSFYNNVQFGGLIYRSDQFWTQRACVQDSQCRQKNTKIGRDGSFLGKVSGSSKQVCPVRENHWAAHSLLFKKYVCAFVCVYVCFSVRNGKCGVCKSWNTCLLLNVWDLRALHTYWVSYFSS